MNALDSLIYTDFVHPLQINYLFKIHGTTLFLNFDH
jgi:hypothetical protein